MALDLSSLQKAVASLESAITISNTVIKGEGDTGMKEVIRAGVIQNFEFTYELCWKFMKRWIEDNSAGEVTDGMTLKELFRVAAERHLIKDVEVWFTYQKARNKTSHIYDETVAEDVYTTAVSFLKDAQSLLKVLESKND